MKMCFPFNEGYYSIRNWIHWKIYFHLCVRWDLDSDVDASNINADQQHSRLQRNLESKKIYMHFKVVETSFSDIWKVTRMSIGPSLPPHLQHRAHRDPVEDSGDSDDSEDDIGPRLPEVACRGPAPIGPRLPELPSESSGGIPPAGDQQTGICI